MDLQRRVVIRAGELWRECGEKEHYQELANQDAKRFAEEMASWEAGEQEGKKPKKGLTAYMCFLNEKRSDIKKALIDGESGSGAVVESPTKKQKSEAGPEIEPPKELKASATCATVAQLTWQAAVGHGCVVQYQLTMKRDGAAEPLSLLPAATTRSTQPNAATSSLSWSLASATRSSYGRSLVTYRWSACHWR